jgi:hypothetical protein
MLYKVDVPGAPQLPEPAQRVYDRQAKSSFASESRDFFFTCEGEVALTGQDTSVKGTVTIDVKHQDKSDYTKLFGGSLIIDGMEFNLVFESYQVRE